MVLLVFWKGTWTYWRMTHTWPPRHSFRGRIFETVEWWLILEHFGKNTTYQLLSHVWSWLKECLFMIWHLLELDHTLGDRALWWRGSSFSYNIICWLLHMDWGLEGALVDYFTLSSCLEPCALVRWRISTLDLTSTTFGGGCWVVTLPPCASNIFKDLLLLLDEVLTSILGISLSHVPFLEEF